MSHRGGRTKLVRYAAGSAIVSVPAVVAVLQYHRLRSVSHLPVPTYTIDATVGDGPGDGTGRARRLVVVGDSLVAGVGAPWPHQSLPWQLAEQLHDRLGSPVHVTGLGRPSATTADIAEHQVPRIPRDAEIVVVVAGANDILRRTPPGAFARSFAALLDGVSARTDAAIVVVGMPDFRSVRALMPAVRASVAVWAGHLHERQRRISLAHGAVFADTKAEVARAFRRDPGMLGNDRFHPSVAGYALLARTLAPHVAEILDVRRH